MLDSYEVKVEFETENKLIQKLMDSAAEKSLGNIKMFGDTKVLVEGGGYEKIWLETQPMGGAMYGKRDLEIAQNNCLMFMQHQRADGRIPGSIALIDGVITPQFNKFQGFCFADPAMDVYYMLGEDREFLDQLYECLEKFDAYLWKVRDSDNDGCLETWCKYDTGEDNAERYMDAPNDWTSDEPPKGYKAVPMASMDVMSYSYSCRNTLSTICHIMGEPERGIKWLIKAQEVSDKIRDYLWDNDRNALFDRDNQHKVMPTLTHNTLRAMYWKSISRQMADRFVKTHLINPDEFWTNMPLPSVAVNDPLFRNVTTNNWSGQAEALTYQRAIRALENYGYERYIPYLGKKLFGAIGDKCRFVQQYDPFTMEPSVVSLEGEQDGYGPAMLSVMEYVSRMYGVHIDRKRIIWGSYGDDKSVYTQLYNGHRYRMENDKDKARGFIDDVEFFTCDRNSRVITDLDGNVKTISRYE